LQEIRSSPLERPRLPILEDKSPSPELSAINWTEVVYPQDPRSKLSVNAKQRELFGLIERGIFRPFLNEDAGVHPNTIPSRFVLSINHESGVEKLKT
jgi:hypothetical protein